MAIRKYVVEETADEKNRRVVGKFDTGSDHRTRVARAPVFGLLLLGLVLAGCFQKEGLPPPSKALVGGCVKPEAPLEGSGFQGENAWIHVARLTCDFEASPAVPMARVPGTPQRDWAADYLVRVLDSQGWNASFQNFTGNDYEAHEKGSLAVFQNPPYCQAKDLVRARGLHFSNVLGTAGQGERVLLLMAHYDSKRFANRDASADNQSLPVVGANDGASGVGVLLELSRVLDPSRFRREVRLLLVDGEDGFEDCHADAGSLHYARTLPASDRDRIDAVLLLDMVGDLDARYCLAGGGEELASRLRDHAARLDVSAVAQAPGCFIYDDHTPFEDLGVAAIDLIDSHRDTPHRLPPYWHTRADTLDKISPLMLRDVGHVVQAVVESYVL